MKHVIGLAVAALLALAALAGSFSAPAHAQAAGPEGQAYALETREGRYNARFLRGGRYEDTRGATGVWQFDGRTLCIIIRPPRGMEYETCIPWRGMAVGERHESRAWTPDGSPALVIRIE